MRVGAVILLVAVLMLPGCSTTKQLDVINKPVDTPALEIPPPPPLSLEDINWKVITSENVEQVLKDLEDGNMDVVLFALTDRGYQRLAKNSIKTRNYIRQLIDVLNAYKAYYEDGTKKTPD